jgi:membrane protein implicated in regulation of membrane protease activity
MSWQAFYLGCFGVGLVLSLVSFLSGALHLHLPVKWHLHIPGGHSGHVGGHVGGAHSGSGARGQVHHGASHFPLFNSASLMIFLAWFGGVGFLLTTHARLWFLTVLLLATLAGLSGAALVAAFLVKVLDNPDAALEPMDFQMVGAVGKVNIGIRPGGTGEILYVQGGTRRSAGARSEDGKALEKGAEVVITRFERGIAYVRLWEEFTKEG